MGRASERIDKDTAELLETVENHDDPRVGYAALRRRIDSLRTAGNPVPDALLAAERLLAIECMAESQGR